jgi:serine phosphatase RsbU (regulator of sigma subunit)
LWIQRRNGRIEDIQRTGMALGVFEDSLYEERTFQIEKGDFLILYTDGVTDAFSPQGEAFGDECLRQAIDGALQSAAAAISAAGSVENPTAQEMLDAIDQNVLTFVADALPSDDLTLLVLKRRPVKKRIAGRGGDTPGNLRRATGSTARGGRAETQPGD